ncbi:translocation protein-like protein [Lineolata rhizophorae]|uniref:Translocation protein-like protein n=1 Tax=Lineolata rhizophorae TaxID=578093 RepID=A0A6A6P761_9PEZI|nr:translocation protein-like protein [Lineolata rhizophorae]
MVDWLGLAIPFAYLAVLIGSMATFSSLYRKRKAAKAASLGPWFPPHLQRNIYLSLLHLEGSKKVPDTVLKAALLRRATEDIHRIIAVRTGKQACSNLLQRGSVGDELWQRFQRAERETEEELRDVVNEANGIQPGWGQTIFQSANEIANHDLIRRRIAEEETETAREKDWWEKKRAGIQSDFMRELEDEKRSTSATMDAPVLATNKGGAPVNAGTRGGSDDDAVLVEAGGPAAPGGTQQQTSGGGGGGKKKKGKK